MEMAIVDLSGRDPDTGFMSVAVFNYFNKLGILWCCVP
jgi:hypothetical protein